MKERFSAGGSRAHWLQASQQAMEEAGFSNVSLDEYTGVVRGFRNAPMIIDIQDLESEKIVLEINSDSDEDVGLYKSNVARAFQVLQQGGPITGQNTSSPEEPLGGTPESLRPSGEGRFESAFAEESESVSVQEPSSTAESPEAPGQASTEIPEGQNTEASTAGEPQQGNIFIRPEESAQNGSFVPENEYAARERDEYIKTTVEPDGTIEETDIKKETEAYAATGQATPRVGPDTTTFTSSAATGSIPTGDTTAATAAISSPRPWYQTEWFTLLALVLIPPVGIALMWFNKVFDPNIRKYLSVFFCLYTILWAWLIFLLLVPKGESTPAEETYVADESTNDYSSNDYETEPTQVDLVRDYWDDINTQNFVNKMPALMSQYENLYLNGELGTDAGIESARSIAPQVQDLCNAVLNLPDVGTDSVVYPLQSKVNECANAFNETCNNIISAVDSDDYYALDATTDAWNTAEGLFYEINYTYERVLQSATEADQAASGSSSTVDDTTTDDTTDDSTTVTDDFSETESEPVESDNSSNDSGTTVPQDSQSQNQTQDNSTVQNNGNSTVPNNQQQTTQNTQQQTTTQTVTTEETVTTTPGYQIIEETTPSYQVITTN